MLESTVHEGHESACGRSDLRHIFDALPRATTLEAIESLLPSRVDRAALAGDANHAVPLSAYARRGDRRTRSRDQSAHEAAMPIETTRCMSSSCIRAEMLDETRSRSSSMTGH
jgi:hypothetical protein